MDELATITKITRPFIKEITQLRETFIIARFVVTFGVGQVRGHKNGGRGGWSRDVITSHCCRCGCRFMRLWLVGIVLCFERVTTGMFRVFETADEERYYF